LELFSTISEIREHLRVVKKEGKTIGLVPTMGALHKGHTSLFEKAKSENNSVVSSIFVNPLQFNDKRDLERYPRTLEKDIEKLTAVRCDILFAPSTEEMYPSHPSAPYRWQNESSVRRNDSSGEAILEDKEIDLGMLDKVMEGKQRPGHFQGVCIVVKKLFDIIEPNKAYFGEKDFQQLTIIKYLVKTQSIPVEIVPCPTVREPDGLAMSSRNTFLTPDERKNAPLIFKILQEAKQKLYSREKENMTIATIQEWVKEKINHNPFLKLDYFEIVNSETLQPLVSLDEAESRRACIAVRAGTVRLIDNISF
jgi:pantoate--beta-alanine ligase